MIRIIFYIIACLSILTACSVNRDSHMKDSAASQIIRKQPEWVTHRTYREKYPQDLYISGVGFSENDSYEADDVARLDLLKQIEVEIKGEESAVQTELSQSEDQEIKTQLSSYVRTKVDSKVHMTLPGLIIGERWSDTMNNRYYSLSVLNREDASAYLFGKIEEIKNTVDSLVKGGEDAEMRRDYGVAITRYQEAVKYTRDVQAMLSQYKVIKGELKESPETAKMISSADLKLRIDNLTGKLPKTTELVAWDEGIRDLVLQIVSRVPSAGVLTVAVGDFIEGRSGGSVPLSGLIESDVRTTLAQVEDIRVLEKGNTVSDMSLSGLFRKDGDVLRVNATLKDGKSGAIVTAAKVSINAVNISGRDLLPQNAMSAKSDQTNSYDIAVEQILSIAGNGDDVSPFNVKVWTDKTKYRIGEPVIFYFTADRDCYITLLDQGTSGTLRVLFPNPYQQDNFIRAGKTYAVPDAAAGYEISVDGPSGVERVKVIATLRKTDQLPVDLSKGFYELTPQDGSRIRDLTMAVKKLPDQQWTQGYTELYILPSGGEDQMRPRKITPKRPEKPVDIIGTPGAIDSGKGEKQE